MGKLSAGLAHDLYNSTAAMIRSTRSLNESIGEAARTTRQLGSLRLAEQQLDAMARLRDLCMSRPAAAARSPIDRADHEDAIGDWLSAHGADQAHALALAETPLTISDLDDFARTLDVISLNLRLHCLADDRMMHSFDDDIHAVSTTNFTPSIT